MSALRISGQYDGRECWLFGQLCELFKIAQRLILATPNAPSVYVSPLFDARYKVRRSWNSSHYDEIAHQLRCASVQAAIALSLDLAIDAIGH
jgi:hypothetical protein